MVGTESGPLQEEKMFFPMEPSPQAPVTIIMHTLYTKYMCTTYHVYMHYYIDITVR